MIFFYSLEAGNSKITFIEESFHYLVRVRRYNISDVIVVQDMERPVSYFYRCENIEKRKIDFILIKTEQFILPDLSLHIGWGICDASTIYNTLPSLNQLGVRKISFLQTQRSQGNVKLNPEKIKNICIQSSQQCGRNHLMEWEIRSFEDFISHHHEIYCFDMKGEHIKCSSVLNPIIPRLVGPEGGWTNEELSLIPIHSLKKFSTPFVLRSEVAVCLASF